MVQANRAYIPGRGQWPSLRPLPGLGSYGRTRGAILIGAPRSSIANQGRIYNYYQRRGEGPQYKAYLLSILTAGNPYVYRNAWQVIQ